MKVGASSTDFNAVKTAFESAYANIGILCSDVGGLWSVGGGKNYDGTEPCTESDFARVGAEAEAAGSSNFLAIALSCTFGSLFVVAIVMLVFMRKREKEGNPVFQTRGTFERWREQLSMNFGGS